MAALRRQLEAAVREGLRAEGEEIRAAHHRVQRELEEEIRKVRAALQGTQAKPRPADLAPLLRRVGKAGQELAENFPTAPGSLKRGLVNALIRELPVVIEPGRPYTRRRREVREPVWQEWVLPLLPESGKAA